MKIGKVLKSLLNFVPIDMKILMGANRLAITPKIPPTPRQRALQSDIYQSDLEFDELA